MPDDAAATPEVPLDPEAKALKLEQIKAEARRAILDAQLASAKAVVPTIDASGLKETITLDEKAGSIVNAVAASQLSDAAKAIAAVVKAKVPAGSRVILVEGRSIAEADAAYADLSERFAWFKKQFAKVTADLARPAPAPGPDIGGLVLPVLTAAASIATTTLGLLKSDVSVQGRTVALDDTALKAVLAGQLKAAGLKPVIEGLMRLKDAEVMASLSALWDIYRKLKETAAQRRMELDPRKEELESIVANIAAVQAEYDKARKEGNAAASEQLAAQLAELRKELGDKGYTAGERVTLVFLESAAWLLGMFDAFAASISTVPSGATRSPLQAAALREVVHGRKVGEHLLFATISASGGDAVQKQPNAVGFGGHTKFVAGVVVTYMLIAADGEIVAADVASHYGEKEYRL